jgi:trigger factor
MIAIQIRKTSEEPGAASLAVTVPVERVREVEDQATSDYQRRARLPGFRKGKAPAALVKKQFAEDIRKHALEELIRESWTAALAQEALKPIADPHIHNLKWDAGAPVTFEFHVELKPDLKLERLGGFQLKRTAPKVTEDQVVAQLNELREQKAPWTPVTGEKPKPKDLVHVTLATREGDAVKDPQPYQLVLGEGRAIPDVEERIMQLAPGETVDATVHFPADFPEEAKRGQARDVRITLHEVKRQQLPELDDAFAREVGDFDALETLRKAVRGDLEREAEREADARVRHDLIDQIVQANRVAAPRPLVERALYAYAQAYGISEERWPEFAREFQPVAEGQVRRDLILDWVVDHHGLRATPEELEQKIAELAARRGMPAEELRASLEKAKRLRDLERGLTEEKVFAFLLPQSTVEQT